MIQRLWKGDHSMKVSVMIHVRFPWMLLVLREKKHPFHVYHFKWCALPGSNQYHSTFVGWFLHFTSSSSGEAGEASGANMPWRFRTKAFFVWTSHRSMANKRQVQIFFDVFWWFKHVAKLHSNIFKECRDGFILIHFECVQMCAVQSYAAWPCCLWIWITLDSIWFMLFALSMSKPVSIGQPVAPRRLTAEVLARQLQWPAWSRWKPATAAVVWWRLGVA